MHYATWAATACGIATVFHVVTVGIAATRLSRTRPAPANRPLPPISIVIPVCGLDSFAEETLRSGFRIDYPDYELIYCVAHSDDAAIPFVESLIDAHPERPARLLIGDDQISRNPKLNNVIKGWDAASHDWIAMADSNVLLPQDYLLRLVSRWQDDTGVVCSMPIGTRPHNFAAELECAFLNTLQARYQYVSEAVGFGFAQGKTMFFRRDIVERAGGIRALAAEDAEDAATTKMVRDAGLHVHLVDVPLHQPLGWRSVREVWARQVRWARLRRVTFPLLFMPELVVGAVFPLVGAIFAALAYGWNMAAVLPIFLVLWFGAEMVLARRAGWPSSARSIAALLLRDLLLPVLWVAAVCGRTFTWRGNSMTAGRRKDLRGQRQGIGLREALRTRWSARIAPRNR